MIDRRSWLKLSIVGAGSGLVPVRAAASPIEPGPDSPTILHLSAGDGGADYGPALKQVSAYIALHIREYGLPGLTFCMADRAGFRAVINAGWADVDKSIPIKSDHLFQIGSISKSFGAICVLRAAESGKLKLDDAVEDHLPGVPLPRERITIRQLLAHTTGLPDDAPMFPRGGDERLWVGFSPGTHFSYSNTAYDLLGPMLERIHGQPYGEILRLQLLSPLGMTTAKGAIRSRDLPSYAVGYWPADNFKPVIQRPQLRVSQFLDVARAAGCVAATATDMTHYVRYLIDAGMGQGAPLLTSVSASALTSPVTEAPVFGPKAYYTLGLALVPVNGRMLLHHTGGMMDFSSSLHVDPKAGVGAFASTNSRTNEYRPRDVTAWACALMLAARNGKTAPPAPDIRYDDHIKNADEYAGRWVAADGEAFTLRSARNQLLCTSDQTGDELAALRKSDDDVFVVPTPRFDTVALVFTRQAGKPTAAWWGNKRFAIAPDKAASSATPPAIAALSGLYVNNDPWAGNFRIIARENGLWLDGTEPLTLLPDGSYRVGKDNWGCERLRFDAPIDGRPQRAVRSGVDYVRLVEA